MSLPSMGKQCRQWLLAGSAATAWAVASPSVALAKDRDEDKDKKKEKDRHEDSAKAMFDPEALERGAAALREINKSPNAKQVRPQVQ